MAIRLLSNENIDGNLTINGTGTANAPTLAVDTTSSSVFNHAIEAFNGNLTANEGNYIFVGKEGSSKNTGYIGYKYSGTSGSNSNILTFGHWASDNLMNLTGDGKLGIGTESPDELLHLHNTSQNSYLYMSGGGSLGETYGGFVRGYGVSGQGGHLELGVVDAGTKRIGITIQEQGNQIEFDTAGTERMRIDYSGNVGIGTGTNSVTNQLHVATATDNAYALRIQGSTNNAAGVWTGIGIGGESANTKSAIIFEDIGVSYARGKLLFCINNEQNQNSASPSDAIMTISNDGYVGIGTTDPSSNLHSVITTAGDSALKLQDDTGSVFDFQCGISGVTGDALLIKDTTLSYDYLTLRGGKVGINEANPLIKLHITDEVSTGINLYSTYNYSLNRNWRLMINGFGSGNWGGISLRQSTTNGGTPSVDVFGIDRAGNVGIGINASNTAVKADLHVRDSSQNSNITDTVPSWWNGLFERTYTTTSNAGIGIVGSTQALGAGGVIYLGYSDDVDNNWVGVLSSQAMTFGTNTVERMRITSDGKVGINEQNPTATLHVQTAAGIKLFNDNTYGYISIGSSGLTGQYPYLRVDSFRSDGSGYFWAFGHETPSGVKSIKMLINDGSSDQVTVINSLAISRFTANEFNGSYPSLSTGALIRSNDTSYFNGGNVGIGTTTPLATSNNNTGLNVDTGGHSSILIGDGVNDGGMIQSSDNSQRIIIGANVYDSPTGSWSRFTADSAALVDVYGEGSSAFISFNVDSGTSGFPTNRMHITNTGNVGINTSLPSTRLHIDQPSNDRAGGLYLEAQGQNYGLSAFVNTGGYGVIGSNGIFTNDTILMDLSNGNTGIGVTPTSSQKLYVVSTLQYGVRIDHQKNIGTSSTFEDALFLANTTQSNTNVCRIGMSTNGTDGQHHRVSLLAERDTSANYRGEFSIQMRQSDATHPKRLKLDYAGTLTVSGDVVAYGSPSDKRYKENIKPVTNALDTVSKLQGVTFDWKESKSLLDIKEDIGFIAQDVQEVLPELVRENEDGKLSLRDKGIVPILVEAIKELKAEIEELKNNK